MRCKCGTLPDYCGEQQPDNGRVCMECSTFTCSRCFAAFELLGTEFADRDLCPPCNTAPINFPVEPIASAHASQLIGIARKSRVRALRPEAVNRAMRSVAGLFTQKLRATRSNASPSEVRDMTTPFEEDLNTKPVGEDFILGNSVDPGCIDMPHVVQEVLRNGRQEFGKLIKVADLAIDDLCALQAALDAYEEDVLAQIAALRGRIDERAYTLDVTGGNTLGIAA